MVIFCKKLVHIFDGRQHFGVINSFNGIDSFNRTKKNDQIKNEFAKNNNIKLLRIAYTEYDQIDNILKANT